MDITRRILDTARSRINTIMERIAADDTPLSHVDEEELKREVERRITDRQGKSPKPMDNPRARITAASEEAKRSRERLAKEREARAQKARRAREKAAKAADEEFFRRAKAEAARQSARQSSRSSHSQTGSSSRRGSTGRSRTNQSWKAPFQRQDSKIAEYYRVLNLPYGAEFSEVKTSYRSLMRKYHPDRHVGNAKKQKAATELSMRVTQAYNALEEHLNKR